MKDPHSEILLDVKHLKVSFTATSPPLEAVQDTSFSLKRGSCLAIVGESGSGKSITALALTRLLPEKACTISGQILYKNKDILSLGQKNLEAIRGKEIAYIFQEPSAVLNPVLSIGYQIQETLLTHFPKEKQAKQKVLEALEKVKIAKPMRCYDSYPHELSGGMQQRAMIAMALVCKPSILVADEATTALDVITQKQILELLDALRQEASMAILLITHNFHIVRRFADTTLVMHQGKLLEQGPTESILNHPKHLYTKALLQCIPKLQEKKARLATIDTLMAS
jgi:ABC-type dipeptide/oligopeptide/nickel transport system ATPase component